MITPLQIQRIAIKHKLPPLLPLRKNPYLRIHHRQMQKLLPRRLLKKRLGPLPFEICIVLVQSKGSGGGRAFVRDGDKPSIGSYILCAQGTGLPPIQRQLCHYGLRPHHPHHP